LTPPSIFFLNILYPSFPHFLLSIFHFLSFFFHSPLLRSYFPFSFSFCHPLFLYFLISFASFLPLNFLAYSHGPLTVFLPISLILFSTPCTHYDTSRVDSQSVRSQWNILGPWPLLSQAATRGPRNHNCADFGEPSPLGDVRLRVFPHKFCCRFSSSKWET
jgi:hypothetical protein